MTQANHTPGPWAIEDAAQAGFKPTITNGKSAGNWRGICDVRGPAEQYGSPSKETKANAQLIAAAPDLLDALKDARAFMNAARMDTDDNDQSMLDALKERTDSAITKATKGA